LTPLIVGFQLPADFSVDETRKLRIYLPEPFLPLLVGCPVES
jgi:hypothetical protein